LNVETDDLEKRSKQVDLVGISCVTPGVKAGWKLCERVKNVNPNAATVLGGPHVTALPEESLRHPYVDIVVRGEGEETIAELCHKIEKNEGLRSDRNLPQGERTYQKQRT
jgi:anaerobic magnesium-protoporphyrin IX monomethyl ester cyclase